MTSEEIKWFGKDFLKMYPSYARRELSVKKLVGICEARNEIQGIKGYKIEPTMVGNVEKIKALKENNDA